jgi:hypothetical protein
MMRRIIIWGLLFLNEGFFGYWLWSHHPGWAAFSGGATIVCVVSLEMDGWTRGANHVLDALKGENNG